MNRFQKLATAALVSLLVLLTAGAIVRVTGAGMGCPDWPRCWGCLIPPTKVEQIDFSKLPMKKFQDKAVKLGRDPSTITAESLRGDFNVRHAWTEFLNRMTSMPLSFLSVATFIAAFWQRERRPQVFWMAFASLMIVVINIWIGARVVATDLKPVVITTHLALAMCMLGTLAYCAWRGTDNPWRIRMQPSALVKVRAAVIVLLVVILIEGIIGSQIREETDQLQKLHLDSPRSTWIGELEQTWVYLFHRSFSWVVLLATIWSWVITKRHREGGPGKVEKAVLGIVCTQMVLGLVMAQVHIYSWVQILHVLLSAILLTLVCLWTFGLSREKAHF